MADKGFKVKDGLTIQGTVDTVITADNSGGILIGGLALATGTPKGNTASRPASPTLGDIYSNTQTGYIEVYTAAGWSQLGVIPVVPTVGTATDVGTNIAYGLGSASVTFTPASTGGLASSYTVTSTAGGYSATGSSSPIVVPNIPTGTTATFTVTATNGYGNSLATTATNSITTTSVPQTPTLGTASNPAGSAYAATAPASLTFTAAATGGKSIANYKWSTDGTTYTALSPSQTSSPLSIPGLNSGSSYTLRLKAVNANGDSISTAASNSVTISTVPQTPTLTSAASEPTGGVGRVRVAITAGATGNSPITSLNAVPSSGSTASSATSPVTITGLTPGSSYTVRASATNANGTSTLSSASSAVTASYAVCSSGGTYNGSQCAYDATQYTGYSCPSSYAGDSGYVLLRGCTMGYGNYDIFTYRGYATACGGPQDVRCCYAQVNNPGGSHNPPCTTYTYYGCPSGGSASGSTCLYNATIV